MSTPFKRKTDSSITDGSWSGSLKFCTMTHLHSGTNYDSSTCVFNALSNGQKRTKLSNPTTSLTWHTKNTSISDNLTEAAQTTLAQARGLDKQHWPVILSHLLRLPYSTLANTHPHLGAWQIGHSLLFKTTTLDIKQTPSTRDNSL